jgi:hypothetical protein
MLGFGSVLVSSLGGRRATCYLGFPKAKSLHGNSATLTAIVTMPKVIRQNISALYSRYFLMNSPWQ